MAMAQTILKATGKAAVVVPGNVILRVVQKRLFVNVWKLGQRKI